MSMENIDSRKRPLDGEADGGVTKRSNQGGSDNIHLKILIPAIAGGAIIGKGGETITQIQKEMGASVKMSKAQDFYPGTNERVCLIVGTLEAVRNVHSFIMEQIREKPDQNPKPVDGGSKLNFERHKQVKILVPNSTAGMIIGKNGNYIKEIKEKSDAFVQLSQKSKELNLQERCITIAGDQEQNQCAVDLIIEKIADDPQSASCPNISYADYKGPLASANPTGSPFATGTLDQPPPPQQQQQQRMDHGGGGGGGGGGNMGPNVFNNIGNSMNNLNLNSGQRAMHAGPPPGGPLAGNPAVEAMRATLRGSGYSEHAIDEIIAAVITLANYGLFGFSLNLGGLGLQQGMGGPAGMHNQNHGGVTLANLANIMNAQGGNPSQMHGNNLAGNNGPIPNNLGQGPTGRMSGNFNNGMNNNSNGRQGGDGNPPVFGPVGSTTTTKAGGDTGEGGGSYYANSGPGPMGGSRMGPNGDSAGMFQGPFGGNNAMNQGFSGPNQNSFGLGPGIGGLPLPASNQGNEEPTQKEIEIGEHIIGAVLGPGGKGIVEIQNFTGTNIQISKKGVFAPGTRNRVVTISGTPSGIQNAEYLIRQRTSQEEANRTRQGMRQ